ncbi:MAG: P1 family peptidase [Deinococcales bacterium]
MNQSLTALEGVRVGHWTDQAARTGCTVLLFPEDGATMSAEVRGGAPGTRETPLLAPDKAIEKVHALLLTGGSAFGLAASGGVVQYLEQQGVGVLTPGGRVPIVPSAVIFDLAVGDSNVRPKAEHGYLACEQASRDPVPNGQIGAGTGAMCGKLLGFEHAQAGGLGNARLELGGVQVCALVVANPTGDIVDTQGNVLAGARKTDGSRLSELERLEILSAGQNKFLQHTNTTLIAVGTDANLSKLECSILAQAAQMGLARATRPSHTPHDGDTSFVFSVGHQSPPPIIALVAAVQTVVHQAMVAAATFSR